MLTINQNVNKKALHYIIKNWNTLEFRKSFWCFHRQKDIDDAEGLRRMLVDYHNDLDEDGCVEVTYSQKEYEHGLTGRRMESIYGLQKLPRVIKHSICKNIHLDLDMINAVPTLLLNWCKQRDLEVPFLKDYVENRDIRLKELGSSLTRDEAKRAMLTILNGGDPKEFIKNEKTPEWYHSFSKEIKKTIKNEIFEECEWASDYYYKIDKEIKKSFLKKVVKIEGDVIETQNTASKFAQTKAMRSVLSTFYFDLENDAVEAVIKWLNKQGLKPRALVFDGVHVDKRSFDHWQGGGKTHEDLTEALNKHMRKNYNVKFSVKDFDEALELPDLEDYDNTIPVYADLLMHPLDPVREKHMVFADLQKKYHNKIWSSMEEFYEDKTFIKDVSQVIQYIPNQRAPWCIYMSPCNQHHRCSTESMTAIPFSYAVFDKEDPSKQIGEKKFKGIHLFIMNNPKLFPFYTKEVFEPNPSAVGRNELNTYPGFKTPCYTKKGKIYYDKDKVAPFLKHIEQVWASNNPEHYNYILNWIAQIIQTPWKKTGIFILLKGDPGCGKTSPCEYMVDQLFGEHVSSIKNGLENVAEGFNSCLHRKLFININELSTIGKSSYHATFERLKSIITDGKLTLKRKYIPDSIQQNYVNLIATTNNDFTLKIQEGNRRYAVFACSNKRVGDHQYFDNFHAQLRLPGVRNHIMSYFKLFKLNIDLRKIPTTDLGVDMVQASKSASVRFIENLDDILLDIEEDDCYGGCRRPIRKYEDVAEKLISKDKLFGWFIQFCAREHETSVASSVFFRQIKKFTHSFQRKTIGNSRKRLIKLK